MLVGCIITAAGHASDLLLPASARHQVRLPGNTEVLFSDTVGFIQKLPTQLVAAFRATLEEIQDASVILHLVDVSARNAAAQCDAVLKVRVCCCQLGLEVLQDRVGDECADGSHGCAAEGCWMCCTTGIERAAHRLLIMCRTTHEEVL